MTGGALPGFADCLQREEDVILIRKAGKKTPE